MDRIVIPDNIMEEMINLSLGEAPLEACGILSGRGNRVEKFYPVENKDESRLSYFMKPEDQFDAVRKIRVAGHDMLGVFHSHPETPARPSREDIDKAFYPDCAYVIVSLASKTPYARAFSIREGKVNPIDIYKESLEKE